jgi:serine/threonine protein phosphatase PrpC
MNQYLKQYNTLEQVARALEKEARNKGSEDDITILIVLLKDLKHSL